MQDTEQIIELAKLDGLEEVQPSGPYRILNGKRYVLLNGVKVGYGWEKIPPYLNSRDAIVPVIKKQITEQVPVVQFIHCLHVVTNSDSIQFERNANYIWHLLKATPRQLCEALLRATGKWKE